MSGSVDFVRGTGGCRLALERVGARTETGTEAVLLLPGGGQTRHSWRATAQALAVRGWAAWIADLRGHGESDWAADGDYSLDAFRDDVSALLAAIGAPAVVIGGSQGGVSALLNAGERLDPLLAALVMVDIASKLDESGSERLFGFMRGAQDGFARVEEASDYLAAFMPGRPKPANSSGLMRNLRRRADGRLVWHYDPRYVGPDALKEARARTERMEAAARQVAVPTLLLRGAHSEVLTWEDARAFAGLFADVTAAEVPGAGHMIVGDANGTFSALVVDWLERR